MKYLTVDEIRDMWLKFFAEHGHFIEPSASLIPDNDPSLLFINAGVAALKKYFDGRVTPPHRRLTNAQKSIRTNDIENVGRTDRHHTFFEMLGNFSIGDYFRADAIPWAFDLLTNPKWFGFPVEKLYVSYYPADTETKDLWHKCGISADHLIPLQDNFWEIGEGPCGPDTEIYFDRGEKYDSQHLGVKLLQDDIENDRYIELWNIVFSQFNAKPGLKREDYPELPHKNIDTGASLERFACIMQETESNFEIDTFKPIIDRLVKEAKQPYEGQAKMAYRVIADHARCLVFALADGAIFANEGRGYVLRRLLRRADRLAKSLGLNDKILAELVPMVVETNDHFYPYLKDAQDKIVRQISAEEERFAQTLKSGEKYLHDFLQEDGESLSAEHAFKLSDTYGFPLDLSREIAADMGKKVDEAGFSKLLAEQKNRARQAREKEGIATYGSQNKDLMEFTTPSEFIYEDKVIKAKVIGLFKKGAKVESLDDEGQVAFDTTNFYAEQGGQVADTGLIENAETQAQITDCQHAPNRQNLHTVKILYGTIKVGDEFTLKPGFATRMLTRKNHSACHLLHQALSDVLTDGKHPVPQEGSIVGPHICRLDFAWDHKLTPDEINLVEANVNKRIQQATPCEVIHMDKEEALKLPAYHQFAAKYGATVRVVKMGDAEEFCGGTHVDNTQDIHLFAIVSEQAIAAGIRRIVAVTNNDAYEFLKGSQHLANRLAEALKLNSSKDVEPKVKALLCENNKLQRVVGELKAKIGAGVRQQVEEGYEDFNGYKVQTLSLENLDHNQQSRLLTDISSKFTNSVTLLIVNHDNKVDLGCALGVEAVKKGLNAGAIVKALAPLYGGNGGGRDNIAFGAGKNQIELNKVTKALKDLLK